MDGWMTTTTNARADERWTTVVGRAWEAERAGEK